MSEPSSALIELVESAELLDISYFELTARRDDDFSGADDAQAEDAQSTYGLGVETSKDQTKFRIRLKVDIVGLFGEVAVEASAEYDLGAFPAERLSAALLVEYANNVAVMALLPYLRQAVADLTLRVFGSPLLMPVLQRGTISFTIAATSQG